MGDRHGAVRLVVHLCGFLGGCVQGTDHTLNGEAHLKVKHHSPLADESFSGFPGAVIQQTLKCWLLTDSYFVAVLITKPERRFSLSK